MGAREAAKNALQGIGLLDPARLLMRRVKAIQRQRYHALVIRQYRSPLARSTESFEAYERRERELIEKAARERFQADGKAIVDSAHKSLPPRALEPGTSVFAALARLAGSRSDVTIESSAEHRKALARLFLDHIIDARLAPRFYDYDYVDDVVGVAGGRYCSDSGCAVESTGAVLDALCILADGRGRTEWSGLAAALRRLLGPDHGYVPLRGDVLQHMRNVIPDLVDEFVRLKGEANVERFLEINREYSRRQAHQLGVWDVRDVSLLRGYERDHHLLLRTIVELMNGGQLSAADEVLIVGPRHIDEIVFFRKSLGLPKTIGLDLFPSGDDEIIAGDMHHMPFAPGRFKLVFCAGTITYSYNVRRVVDEMARVTTRPGFVFLIDAGGRKVGTNAQGRSDIPTIDTMVGLFHRTRFSVLARDAGRSLAPQHYDNEPCCAVKLEAGPDPLPGGAESARFLRACE
jgi:hypothetical protein